MARRRLELDRPQPKTPYRVLVRNQQVFADWDELVRTRRGICIRLWDHISSTPTTPIGSRYLPLRGSQQWVEFDGEMVRQWQYEVDNAARVKVAVSDEFVVVMAVSSGYPKENE